MPMRRLYGHMQSDARQQTTHTSMKICIYIQVHMHTHKRIHTYTNMYPKTKKSQTVIHTFEDARSCKNRERLWRSLQPKLARGDETDSPDLHPIRCGGKSGSHSSHNFFPGMSNGAPSWDSLVIYAMQGEVTLLVILEGWAGVVLQRKFRQQVLCARNGTPGTLGTISLDQSTTTVVS